jgi:hypothetical protein
MKIPVRRGCGFFGLLPAGSGSEKLQSQFPARILPNGESFALIAAAQNDAVCR